MVIKPFNIPLLLLIIVGVGICCTKKEDTCPKLGYEFTYLKPSVFFSPLSDSIPLGDSLILEASVPKTFFDEEKGYSVTLNQSTIFGSLVIKKVTTDPLIPILGAIEDVRMFPIIGTIIKDSLQFSVEQLKIFRTTYWTSVSDSFKVRISIKPIIKGTFFIGLNQQSNRDSDCALYKYFIKVKNLDQHLYLFAQSNNGFIDDYSRNYTYCVKVY